ncbi:WbqC-like protein family protein [Arenibacter algicola]|uniref:WbqC-like protein family protein n=2 Tax=Arenibacter algicola TaxID=616991 RepID=A0A221V4C9_9FLAO|nr:WbqC-like protein family protein [Arenibacter algicola]|tara:strand:+ start:241 stop:453 length:213 start_codon:yes stop_codon:yes gene_type:complete
MNYINVIAGQKLYNKNYFENNDVPLNFVPSLTSKYHLFNINFKPILSIIDELIFNSVEEIKEIPNNQKLV